MRQVDNTLAWQALLIHTPTASCYAIHQPGGSVHHILMLVLSNAGRFQDGASMWSRRGRHLGRQGVEHARSLFWLPLHHRHEARAARHRVLPTHTPLPSLVFTRLAMLR